MDYNFGSQIKEQQIQDDMDCNVCEHGQNIAEAGCKKCGYNLEDEKEKMIDNDIEQIRLSDFL